MRQKKLSKSTKMLKISQTDSLHDSMFELIILCKSKSASFSHKFCSYFIGCGFAYCVKS